MKTFKSLIPILFLALIAIRCNSEVEKDEALQESGPFMKMKQTDVPIPLFPELIASSLDEYNGTFSPDGKEFYFTTNTPKNGIICFTELDENNHWMTPIVAPFSGEHSEYDPLFSPDGKRLYFSSERPISVKDSTENTHIWFVDRIGEGWSDPKHLDLDKTGAFYSSITNRGDIYFNNWDSGDMFKATKIDEGYEVNALPAVLNSENGEGDPFISPEEDYLIYRGYNNSLGRGDLYISYKIGETWTEPENLGEPINSDAHEMCPYVTTDGKFFIFSSSRISDKYPAEANTSIENVRDKHRSFDNGQLNIFYISADFIGEKRKKYEIK